MCICFSNSSLLVVGNLNEDIISLTLDGVLLTDKVCYVDPNVIFNLWQ